MLYAINNFRDEFQIVAMLLILLAAFRWGAGPERASALSFASLFLLDQLYHLWFGHVDLLYRSIDIGHAAIDLTIAFPMFAIALVANRMYPLCLAAFQLLAVSSHLIREVSPQISPMAFFVLVVSPSYLQIISLAAGIALHARRKKRFGPYRSWRVSSPLLQALDPGN